MAFKDETGNRYGRLEVLSYHSRSEGKARHPRFLCKCDCGNELVVLGTNLRRNHTTSCGCVQVEKSREGIDKWRESFVPSEEVGKVYGKLTVESFAGWIQPDNHPSRISTWNTVCSCGTRVVKRVEALADYSSCGCWTKEKMSESAKKHGMAGTPTHMSWRKMLERCYSDSYRDKEYYQEKGIVVCDKWKTFEGFYEDMGERPDGMTLDRIDGNLGYTKENCRWTTPSVQAFNRKMNANNSTGRTGVYKQRNGLYWAGIGVDNEMVVLGRHLSFKQACELRDEAELEYYGWNKE